MQTEVLTRSHPPVREFKPEELPNDPVFSPLMEAEYRANSFRNLLWSTGTEFGDEFNDVTHRNEYWHHNRPHAYHVEKTLQRSIKEFYLYAPQIFDAPREELLSDFSAATLAVQFHDLGQLFAQKRYDGGEEDLKVKEAHGLDAAAMILTLAPEYARACRISLAEAQEITIKAAVMVMDHEHPDHFDSMFHSDNLHAASLSEEDRINAFKDHKLNLWSMGVGDIFDILEHERKKTGYINGKSKIGLTPSFERVYGPRVEQIRKDYTPFHTTISPESVARMKHLTEAFFFSDMFTMISPVFLTLMRTFQAQRSKQRGFSYFHGLNKPTVDQVFHLIINGSGQTLKADDYRKLWEFVHIDGVSEGSVFSDVPWVRQAIKDHAGRGVLAFQMIGEAIMLGDYSVINDVFDRYIREYEKKYESKIEKGETPYEDLSEMITRLELEKDSVIEGLQHKHKGYSKGDAEDFVDLTNRVGQHIQRIYGISQEEFDMMRIDAYNGKDAPTQPFDAFSIPSTEMNIVWK